MNPKVSIIILNWNSWKDTIECLESLYQITYPIYDVIAINNGSIDSLQERSNEKFPYIKLIENKENLWSVEGNNIFIKKTFKDSEVEYIATLNNDLKVESGWLKEKMLKC